MTPYEYARSKRIEVINEKIHALNLPILAQSLVKSSSATKKPSSGRSRFVQPGALEVANKKRLRSHDLPQAPPPPTHVTPPPAPVQETYPLTSKVTTLPEIVEVTELPSSQATSHNHSIPFPDSEDDVLDDAPNITKKKKSKYWDLEVINGAGHVSNMRLVVYDVLLESPNGTRIITRWNGRQPVGEAAGFLASFLGTLARMYRDFPIMFESWDKIPEKTKTKVYDEKIKTKFVVDDGDNKSYILTSIGRKWKDERCRLFKEHYKWDLPLEVNLANYPCHIDPTDWALFVAYRRKPDTQKKARKNVANRKKLTTPHTLGKMSLARKKDELEVKDGREYSRAEMFSVSHKDSKGLYVNEEAKKKAEQLQIEMQNTPENEAFVKVFGKEHPGYVRSMGLGIPPSQISTSHRARATSSFEANEKMLKMQAEIDSLKDKASQVDILKEQVAFLMQMQNSREKQPTNTESPRDGVRSSESSYRLENHEQHH
ncbi:putative transposase, Ptta/En/Spm, plant [Medicago truncatula]|uniref:Putative transposase, Ptta/En/Spm, plant n=1 Tax=Medicago truncatula TaxID=3880 RepID=A0A396J752_MEDTR|nr:uncharacterized protein LOC25480695 isoform X2 [Medicago truncatula]RHN74036.1 putative transposase, Ptta/En/Spm, plant [Medicago truncatula]